MRELRQKEGQMWKPPVERGVLDRQLASVVGGKRMERLGSSRS